MKTTGAPAAPEPVKDTPLLPAPVKPSKVSDPDIDLELAFGSKEPTCCRVCGKCRCYIAPHIPVSEFIPGMYHDGQTPAGWTRENGMGGFLPMPSRDGAWWDNMLMDYQQPETATRLAREYQDVYYNKQRWGGMCVPLKYSYFRPEIA